MDVWHTQRKTEEDGRKTLMVDPETNFRKVYRVVI